MSGARCARPGVRAARRTVRLEELPSEGATEREVEAEVDLEQDRRIAGRLDATCDLVCIEGRQGHVVRLISRATVLLTLDGNHVRIPNATVYKA